jgi:hypothetical protein
MGKIEDKLFSHQAAAIVLFTGVSLIVLGFMGYFGLETFIKWLGADVDAEVTMPAYYCEEGKYSSPYIIVVYGDETYNLDISKEDCLSGRFQPGSIVKVKKHSLFNRIVSRDSHPEYIFLPLLLYIVGSAVWAFRS